MEKISAPRCFCLCALSILLKAFLSRLLVQQALFGVVGLLLFLSGRFFRVSFEMCKVLFIRSSTLLPIQRNDAWQNSFRQKQTRLPCRNWRHHNNECQIFFWGIWWKLGSLVALFFVGISFFSFLWDFSLNLQTYTANPIRSDIFYNFFPVFCGDFVFCKKTPGIFDEGVFSQNELFSSECYNFSWAILLRVSWRACPIFLFSVLSMN